MARLNPIYKAIGIAEVSLGVGAIAFAVFLHVYFRMLHPGADPHGIIFFGALATLVFGIVALVCGLLFRYGVVVKIASQVVFVLALAFLYVEWFTSYAGWYF